MRNGRERNSKVLWFPAGTRKDCKCFQNSNTHRHAIRQVPGAMVGHRGVSRHQWWRGPREPPPSGPSLRSRMVVTLFVDGISNAITLPEIRKLFESEGRVADVYISGKKRKNKEDSFGFVRFYHERDAMSAIQKLNGATLHGCKLTVTVAKYKKGGTPVKNQRQTRPNQKLIQYPSIRDHRTYADVLTGRRSVSPPVNREKDAEPRTQVPLIISENQVINKKLEFAIVVEVEPLSDVKKAIESLKKTELHFLCVSLLSPVKILLFFEDEVSVYQALLDKSPLHDMFLNVRRWGEDVCFKERFAWIECLGIHPKCWSHENLTLIGEKWGKIVRMDYDYYGLNSITSVRMLIRTSSYSKIDEYVMVQWESGAGEIWVREFDVCECKGHLKLHPDGSLEGGSMDRDDTTTMSKDKDGVDMGIREDREIKNNRTLELELEHNAGHELAETIDNGDKIASQPQVGIYTEGECEVNEDRHVQTLDLGGFNANVDAPLSVDPIVEEWVNSHNLNAAVESFDPVTLIVTSEIASHNLDALGPNSMEMRYDSQVVESRAKRPRGRPKQKRIVPCLEDTDCEVMSQTPQPTKPTMHIEPNVRSQSTENQNGEMPIDIQTPGSYSMGECSKRLRGRPKKIQVPPPTPRLLGEDEARETWKIAKAIGIKSLEEEAVIAELRKSKRIQIIEENTHSGGC